MKNYSTKFKGLIIFKSENFKDSRGSLRELSLEKHLKKRLIFSLVSKSKKNVLRGLHFQHKKKQGKYVTVLKGRIIDIAVDLRKNSKTFGKYIAIKISYNDDFSFYIPKNFAHGFLCLSKDCTVNYKCSEYRNEKSETTINWSDKDINIKWPIKKPILSKKDANGISLIDFKKKLK